MAEVTVKQLADTVGAPVDRLLKQMQQLVGKHAVQKSVLSTIASLVRPASQALALKSLKKILMGLLVLG